MADSLSTILTGNSKVFPDFAPHICSSSLFCVASMGQSYMDFRRCMRPNIHAASALEAHDSSYHVAMALWAGALVICKLQDSLT